MAKRANKGATPYAHFGSRHDMNVRFYEGYDENFLYNKAVTLWYVIDKGGRSQGRRRGACA
jgi:hypothetical protein